MSSTTCILVHPAPKPAIRAICRRIAAETTDFCAAYHVADGRAWFAVPNLGTEFSRAFARDLSDRAAAAGVSL